MSKVPKIRGFYSDSDTEYIIKPEHKVFISNHFAITGISYAENGCCEDQPILITVTRETVNKETPVYSCQCACGMWCTTGHFTDWEALKDYEEMTKRSKEERHNEAI